MKYLQNQYLIKLTQELTDAVAHNGSNLINGRIEAFSCKRAGNDKRAANALAERIENEIEVLTEEKVKYRKNSPGGSNFIETYSSSPLGDLTTADSYPRKLMTDLMLTLNLSFPDYDFSSLKADDFIRLSSPFHAIDNINQHLSELATDKRPGFLSEMWKTIDNVIFLQDCIAFSYVPPDHSTDFFSTLTQGSSIDQIQDDSFLWSFNYFFVNRSLKRIVVFTCVESYLVNKGMDVDDAVMNITFDMDYDW